MGKQLTVKFLARTAADQDKSLWLSLFKGRNPEIGDIRFTFDVEAMEYDWLVVYEDLTFLPGETKSNRAECLACPRDNTLFITTEPTSIKIYGRAYLRQFGHVLTRQPRQIIKHAGHIEETPPLRWYYGRPMSDNQQDYTDLDTFTATPPIKKTHSISTVCSNKRMTPTLKQRYDFVSALKDIMGDELDWFGRSIRPISDKAEAMDNFKYHIAIENHIQPGHWTEKITDCFLAYCLPLYYGPPDIGDCFPPESIIPIDIFDVKGAAEIIWAAISNNEYERRLGAIKEARKLTLTKYNLMNTIADIVQTKHVNGGIPQHAYIYGRHKFRSRHKIKALGDAFHEIRFKQR